MPGLQTGAIVLAAGRSRRMGKPKQLLPLLNRPAILHCLDAFHGAGLQRPVVVLAPDGGDIAGVLGHRSVTIAWNPVVDCEMADSVRTGLKASPSSWSGLVVCPADYPLISHLTVAALAAGHNQAPDRILIPVNQGRRGHPVLFPRALLGELDKDLTLRDLIRNQAAKVVHLPVDDEGILFDMDTPADYESMCRRIGCLGIS